MKISGGADKDLFIRSVLSKKNISFLKKVMFIYKITLISGQKNIN